MFFKNLIKPKYNENTFNANSDNFKSRLQELHHKAIKVPGAGDTDIGRTLARMGQLVDQYKYKSSFNPEQIKAVDERIARVLDRMEESVHDDNLPALASFAEVLFKALKDARQQGKEKYPEDCLKAYEVNAESTGEMLKCLNDKARLQDEIADIKARARAARDSGDMVELQRIDMEFQRKNYDMTKAQEAFEDWKRRYDDSMRSISEHDFEARLGKLEATDLESPEKLQMKVAKNTQRFEAIVEKEAARSEIVDEAATERGKLRAGATSSKGSVMDQINEEDTANMFGNSTGSSQGTTASAGGYTPSAGLLD